MTKTTFTITGMSCVNCAARIEKGFGDVTGIVTASVNFGLLCNASLLHQTPPKLPLSGEA
jgi:cation transport ATPase